MFDLGRHSWWLGAVPALLQSTSADLGFGARLFQGKLSKGKIQRRPVPLQNYEITNVHHLLSEHTGMSCILISFHLPVLKTSQDTAKVLSDGHCQPSTWMTEKVTSLSSGNKGRRDMRGQEEKWKIPHSLGMMVASAQLSTQSSYKLR